MAHFNNYDHEREKLEEIIQILIWRQFKILVYDGSNDVVQPIVFFINQLRLVFVIHLVSTANFWLVGSNEWLIALKTFLRYFKQEQFVAKTRFEVSYFRLNDFNFKSNASQKDIKLP